MAVKSPSLPFDESFYPCTVYVAMHDPKRVLNFFSEGHDMFAHVAKVCQKIDKPIPEGFQVFA